MKPEYELTPGVVSQTPCWPGFLKVMLMPLGEVIDWTPTGSAGSCRFVICADFVQPGLRTCGPGNTAAARPRQVVAAASKLLL